MHVPPVAYTGGSCAHCPSSGCAAFIGYEAGIANCCRSLALLCHSMYVY